MPSVPASLPCAALCACLVLLACPQEGDGPNRTRHIPAPEVVRPEAPEPAEVPILPPARPRWVLFGGGADPASNPISLAHDLDSLAQVLHGEGVVLFAGGRSSPMAVERPLDERPDDVRTVLAELFATPGHAQLEYQSADFTIHGAATRERVLATLRMALGSREDTLLLYFAGHGEQGESPAQNRMLLWGGGSLQVFELAELLDELQGPRRVRLVSTACFSGGFSEFLFEGATPPALAPFGVRCGVFAAPWDDEASGCDPNPDRRAHESYALHLIRALQQPDRARDLDGDGAIGLLDAHTYARVAAQSFDVPTTTSERFVRLRAAGSATPIADLRGARGLMPEEAHLLSTLGQDLNLPDEPAAWQRVSALETQLQHADEQLAEAEARADQAYYDLRIALLERWPLLEHPHRTDHDTLLTAQGAAVLEAARDSDLAIAYTRARADLAPIAARYDRLRVQRARALRVARAFETLRLTQALLDAGDPGVARLKALRACERAVP